MIRRTRSGRSAIRAEESAGCPAASPEGRCRNGEILTFLSFR